MKFPIVPRADDIIAVDAAFAKRPADVVARVRHRAEFSVLERQRDVAVVDADARERRAAQFVGGADIARLARVLRVLADRLDERMPPADVARAIVIEAQLLLLLHATPRTASARAAEGLVTAGLIRSEPIRTAVLAALTPVLPRTALAAAMALARRLRDRHRRAERLAALAVRASEVRAAGTASYLVVQVAQLPGALGEPSMLGILAGHAHLVTPSELARIWCPAPGEGLLRDPGNESRDELLAALATFRLALACLGGTGISAAVDRVVRTVRGWWP